MCEDDEYVSFYCGECGTEFDNMDYWEECEGCHEIGCENCIPMRLMSDGFYCIGCIEKQGLE